MSNVLHIILHIYFEKMNYEMYYEGHFIAQFLNLSCRYAAFNDLQLHEAITVSLCAHIWTVLIYGSSLQIIGK